MSGNSRNAKVNNDHFSWLALEQMAQRTHNEPHLAQCARCAQRLRFIQQDSARRILRPLPAKTERPHASHGLRSLAKWWFAPVGFAAAIALLAIWPFDNASNPYTSKVTVKGGTLAMTLVRERNGILSRDPQYFAQADRFKIEVSSPPALRRYFQVVVFQGHETFFPLAAGTLAGGNAETIPGAFTLSGKKSATVCVATATAALHSKRYSQTSDLPRESVCVQLVAQTH